MAIIGFNQAREYNSQMTNTLQNHVRNQGYVIIEENEFGNTMTELVYENGQGTRYAYIQEVGGMSDAPGQQSIISDQRMTYREASDAILREENK